MFIIFKIIITAILIVAITEIAKLNDRIGGLIAALPITTFIILFWLYYENNPVEKISNHVSYTLLYVIPTLPMFLVFPTLINRLGFYWSIFLSVLITTFFVIVVHLLSKKFGYKII
jgi:hypothetical protein|tara:strand:+ start:83 stop:430 length:348 start_codon:yes stop_codon:yes gene_type:complete